MAILRRPPPPLQLLALTREEWHEGPGLPASDQLQVWELRDPVLEGGDDPAAIRQWRLVEGAQFELPAGMAGGSCQVSVPPTPVRQQCSNASLRHHVYSYAWVQPAMVA